MTQTPTRNYAASTAKSAPAVVQLVLTPVMTALVFVVTFLPFLRIPLPGVPGGYFNFGDIVIFAAALTFGPVVGGFAGGVGSSLADVASGSAAFAPFTLVVKGSEGLVAGYVARRGFRRNELLAWLSGGFILVAGYFMTVTFLYGLPLALFPELPADIVQAVSGGAVGLPVSRVLRNSLPAILLQGRTGGRRPPGPG